MDRRGTLYEQTRNLAWTDLAAIPKITPLWFAVGLDTTRLSPHNVVSDSVRRRVDSRSVPKDGCPAEIDNPFNVTQARIGGQLTRGRRC